MERSGIGCQCGGAPTTPRLPGWTEVFGTQIASAVEETGMLRILGLDCPLDIFRRPNEFNENEFEAVASRTSRSGDGTLLRIQLI
jgi:hypothetical protein